MFHVINGKVHPKQYGKKDMLAAILNYIDLLYNYYNNGMI